MLRWFFILFALSTAAQEGYRATELHVASSGKPLLKRLSAADTGIQISNYVSEVKRLENSLLPAGAGVAAGDVDGDGWCDVYISGAEHPNGLFRNLGNWKFENVTASSGLQTAARFATGVVLADIDGDGLLDLRGNR